jgi:hypothetical protein
MAEGWNAKIRPAQNGIRAGGRHTELLEMGEAENGRHFK